MRSGLKYSWKGVMNSSCCERQAEQLPPAARHPPPSSSPPAPPPQHPLGVPHPLPSPRRQPSRPHHGGGGEHAGGGVGPRHGRHAQVLLSEALVRHGAPRQRPPRRRPFNAPRRRRRRHAPAGRDRPIATRQAARAGQSERASCPGPPPAANPEWTRRSR